MSGGLVRAGRQLNPRCLVVLSVVVLFGSALAQQPVQCPGLLSEQQMILLLQGSVPEKRLQEFIATCGLEFSWSDQVERRLRGAGASNLIVAATRERANRSS